MRSITKRHFQITSCLTELYLFRWQFINEDTFLCFSKEECILAMCSPGHISVVAGHQLNRHSVIINSTLNSKLTHLLLIKKKFKLNTMWTWKLCFTYQSDVNLHLFNSNTLYQMNEIYTGKKSPKESISSWTHLRISKESTLSLSESSDCKKIG